MDSTNAWPHHGLYTDDESCHTQRIAPWRTDPPSANTRLAADGARAGGLVRALVVVGLASAAVNADLDAGVVGLVGARQGDGLAGLEVAAASDLDLGAGAVELGATLAAGAVQSEQLNAEQVLARGDALGHVEVVPAAALDHAVDGPLATAGVEVVLGDLEPAQALVRAGGSVVDLGEPGGDGALVRGGDRVVNVVGELGAPEDVLPVVTDAGASGHADDLGVGVAGLAADDVVGLDILHGVVVVGGTETGQLALVLAVDGDGLVMVLVIYETPKLNNQNRESNLEDGMALDRGGESQRGEDGELHGFELVVYRQTGC